MADPRDPNYPTYPSDSELADIISQDHPKSGVVPTSWGMEDMQAYCEENDDPMCDEMDMG